MKSPEVTNAKILVLGPPGVGKTTLIRRFTTGYFEVPEGGDPLVFPEERLNCQYGYVHNHYYKSLTECSKPDVVLFIIDATVTSEVLGQCLETCKSLTFPSPMVLIYNKVDKDGVPKRLPGDRCEKFGKTFIPFSGKSLYNIDIVEKDMLRGIFKLKPTDPLRLLEYPEEMF